MPFASYCVAGAEEEPSLPVSLSEEGQGAEGADVGIMEMLVSFKSKAFRAKLPRSDQGDMPCAVDSRTLKEDRFPVVELGVLDLEMDPSSARSRRKPK